METLIETPPVLGKHVRARAGDLVEGDNPRPESEIDPDYIQELADSFVALGAMLQWPLVKRLPDGRLKIIAGHCRIRGWILAFGKDAEVDLIETDKDEKAWLDAAAMTENVIRRAMSPVAEAEAAARMLGQCGGDRDETAKRLGWKRPMLDDRLKLMYAEKPVREALAAKQILLGHAELLALMRKESQEAALAHLLSMLKDGKTTMSVADFKAHLERAALALDLAIFDKADCVSCRHNSSNSLFAETISGGKCANKACYDEKTEKEIEKRAQSLRDEWQVVRIAKAGENFTIIPLVAEGAKGVGVEQAEACKACKDYGAVVSAVPDKLGKVYTGMCMNVPCNTKMVAARIKAEQAAAAKLVEADAGAKAPAGAGKGKAAESKSSSAAKPAAAAVKYPEPSRAVREYREKLWRAVFQRFVTALDVQGNRSILLAIALSDPSVIDHEAIASSMKELVPAGASPNDFAKALSMVREYSAEQLANALKHVAANVSESMPIEDIVAALKSFGIKLADHWKVKKEFFELLTKNEVDVVCQEIGIAKAMGSSYAKAKAGGKPDYINAVLSVENFDYHGRIPKLVSW